MSDPTSIGGDISDLRATLMRLRALAEEQGQGHQAPEPACALCRDLGTTYSQTADGIVLAAICQCRRAAWAQKERSRVQAGLGALHQAAAITQAAEIIPDEHSRDGLRWAREWSPDRPGAVIWGRTGSGKSTLLCRLLRRLGPRSETVPDAAGHTVCLVSVPGLLGELAYRQHRGGYSELLALIGTIDVLAIDDLGVGKLHRGWPAQLWSVLDARWSAGHKPVLVTSNHDPGAMRERLVCAPEDSSDLERAMDRLRVLAPTSVQYDAPASRRA